MLNALKICVFVVNRKKVSAWGMSQHASIEYLRKLTNEGLFSYERRYVTI